MAIKAKYTQPIQVVIEPEVRAELKELSDVREVSMAKIIRDCIDAGLPIVRSGDPLLDR